MGRPQTYDALADVCEDVSRDAYLAGRRPLPRLFDLVLSLGSGTPSSDMDVARLAALVREQGEEQSDVRLLVNDAQRSDPQTADRYLTAARRLANALRCDVYLPPHDARIRYVRESNSVTGESWDAMAVHTDTAEPTNWILVRPDHRTTAVPTWFVNSAGRLRPNHGLITVPLPQGLAFATVASFRGVAALAGQVGDRGDAVTTLAVTADLGRFEISHFNEAAALLGGVEFATLVAACLDLIHPDIQLSLTWPTDTAACVALDVELMHFADKLDRTVWVPRPAGSTTVLGSCGELAALDEDNRPSTWRAYVPRKTRQWRPAYTSDANGRLVLIDRPAVGVHGPRDPIAEAVRQAERDANRPVFMPASPTILLATLGAGPAHPIVEHCVSWLSQSVVVNQDPVDLFVWMPPAAAHADGWAVSSPDVFLLAAADPQRLVGRAGLGRLLRLTAPARTAIDLSQHVDQAPAAVSRRIRSSGCTHLLPLTWLARYRVTGLFDVDGRGVLVERPGAAGTGVDVQFDDAEHGIPGLPNDVVSWPSDEQRAGTPSYLVLPEHGQLVHNGYATLTREQPPLRMGQRVLEIRVRRRHAIDVPATLERLAALPMISRLRDLARYDVLLAEQDFPKAVVSKVWRFGPDGETILDKLAGDTLSDILGRRTP